MGAPVTYYFVQDWYHGREDDNGLTSATYITISANTPWSKRTNEPFRIRFNILETNGAVKQDEPTFNLQAQLNGGTWYDIATAGFVEWVPSSYVADGTTITTGTSDGRFVSSASNAVLPMPSSANIHMEYCVQLAGEEGQYLVGGDVVRFRVVNVDVALNEYTNIAEVTAQFWPKATTSVTGVGSVAMAAGVKTGHGTAQLSCEGSIVTDNWFYVDAGNNLSHVLEKLKPSTIYTLKIRAYTAYKKLYWGDPIEESTEQGVTGFESLVTGRATIVTAGAKSGDNAAAVVGSSSVVVTGIKQIGRVATVTGNAAVVSLAEKQAWQQIEIAGSGGAIVQGQPGADQAVAVVGSGEIITGAQKKADQSLSVAGSGDASSQGQKAGQNETLIFGKGVIATTSEAVAAEHYVGVSSVSGNGQLSIAGQKVARRPVLVSGSSSLFVEDFKGAVLESSVSASSKVLTSSEKQAQFTPEVSGSGDAVGVGVKGAGLRAKISESASLFVSGIKQILSSFSVSGNGEMVIEAWKKAWIDALIIAEGGVETTGTATEASAGIAFITGNAISIVEGKKNAALSGSIAAQGEAEATGDKSADLAVFVAGLVGLAAAGEKQARTGAEIVGAGSILTAGATEESAKGTAAITGNAEIVTAGIKASKESMSTVGIARIFYVGIKRTVWNIEILGTSSSAAVGEKGSQAGALVYGTGRVLTTGTAEESTSGSVVITGNAEIVTAGIKQAEYGTEISGIGDWAVNGVKKINAAALIVGNGTVTTTAVLSSSAEGVAAVSGPGFVSAQGLKKAVAQSWVHVNSETLTVGQKGIYKDSLVSGFCAGVSAGQKAAVQTVFVMGTGSLQTSFIKEEIAPGGQAFINGKVSVAITTEKEARGPPIAFAANGLVLAQGAKQSFGLVEISARGVVSVTSVKVALPKPIGITGFKVETEVTGFNLVADITGFDLKIIEYKIIEFKETF